LATLWRGFQQAFAHSPVHHPRRAAPRGTWAETEAWLHQCDDLLAPLLTA
jgi:hypothetical protein